MFVVDGRAGLSSQDDDVANWLRATYKKPLILLCNKIDNPEDPNLIAQVHEISRLGLGLPVAVSAGVSS